MSETRERMLSGALWISFGQFLSNSLGLVSTVVMARLLIPEDFGLVTIAMGTLAILSAVSAMPISEALVQHKDPTEEHYDTAFTITLIRGACVALLVVLSAEPLAWFYQEPLLRDVFYVMALLSFFQGFYNPRFVSFERELRFRPTFIVQLFEKFGGFIVAIAVALIFRNYWALLLGSFATDVVRVLMSYALKPIWPKITLSRWRDLLSFSIWLTFERGVKAFNQRAEPLLYGAYLPTHIVGHFGLSNRLTDVLFGQLTRPVQQVFYPAFSKLQDQPPALQSAYLRAQGVMCLWLLPCAAGFAAVAPSLVTSLIGEKWAPAVPILQLQALILGLRAIVAIEPLAMAIANTKALFHRQLISLFLKWPLVGLGLWAGWSDGAYTALVSALIGSLAGEIAIAVWSVVMVRRLVKVSVRAQFQLFVRPAVASAIMAAAVVGFDHFAPMAHSTLVSLLRVLGICLAGGVVYACLVTALWRIAGRPQSAEVDVLQMLGSLLAKVRRRVPSA